WIVIQIGELDRALFLFSDERRERDMRGSTGWNPHSHAQREDWIEHGAYCPSQLCTFIERRRISHRAAAAHEFCAIRLAGNVTVASDERDAVAGEENAIPLRLRTRRLMRRRPHVTGAEILYVAPLAEVVARTVVSPTRDSEISVPTESAACVRDQRRVGNVA